MSQKRIMFKRFSGRLTAVEGRKGMLDIDTVKGCELGMKAYPAGGCYGVCYACKIAGLYGFDFPISVSRRPVEGERVVIERTLRKHWANWFRIGTMGDPCHDWDNTVAVCEWLGKIKTPIIISKHWKILSDSHLSRLAKTGSIINTSISALDTAAERRHRIRQFKRISKAGITSVLRIVSARFGNTTRGLEFKRVQDRLFDLGHTVDNPLRIAATDRRVVDGDILVERHPDLGGGGTLSISNPETYIGKCRNCPDQCGMPFELSIMERKMQTKMFKDTVELIHIEKTIDSKYAEAIAKLAIEDKVAYRAARKNMQIHSSIVLLINGEFSGFFTFQANHDAKEFCLLQSAMVPGREDEKLYKRMVIKIIEQNTFGYPMVLTCSTKHKLERPSVFESVGFKTYLELSGFAYMVHGTLDQVRMKRLAHATMTNAWTTTRSDWLKMKREWNAKIEAAGDSSNIPNPRFATRDGCWQGSNGYSNVVLTERTIEDGKVKTKKGKSFNGNASVLDPVACEVILRFCMPASGKRIYNPFGGGVQFGFVAASYGYEYVASEIRQNQCDANNVLCRDLSGIATWVQSDSSSYIPPGDFDLCFTCPPYYGVEKYIDYEGKIPEGELNAMPTYDDFRDTLFAGYKQAIKTLRDDRFFVVMTGDSRDKKGCYYGCEAEHELFFRDQGLHIYNKIIYLECEFTRLAHAKRTLDYRKFPKREQKILMFFKGDPKKIKELFPPVGRL